MALLLVLAACSGGGGGGTSAPATRAPDATTAPTPTEPAAPADLRVANLNVLHGLVCTDGDHCDAPNRIALLARLIEESGCPHVVALQEIAPWIRDLVAARARGLCDGAYEVVFPSVGGDYVDVELVLTTLPVRDAQRQVLADGFRRALRVRLDAPIGPVDLVVTHLGTGADNLGRGGSDCTGPEHCPPPCDPAGTVFACQVRQAAALATGDATPGRAGALVVGDFNLAPAAPAMRELWDRGWIDTHLAAGNPECDPASGTGCTGGKDDTTVGTLQDPRSREDERIDYAIWVPGGRCDPEFDPGDDRDRDGLGTGLWADRPARNGPGGFAFVSDHVGTAVDVTCAA